MSKGRDSADLLEREIEIQRLSEAMDQARTGAGQIVFVEGLPGMGKTALLAELDHRLTAAGVPVLHARGNELEQDFGFGVARQLFERRLLSEGGAQTEQLLRGPARFAAVALPGLSGAITESPGPVEPGAARFSGLHGLYWLVSNLAERGPLALVVDDAHWADQPSLSFLSYLAHRLEGLPVLLVIARRPHEPGATEHQLLERSDLQGHISIAPTPLSTEAVQKLMLARLGSEPGLHFGRACHQATGGNPFMVTELCRVLDAEKIDLGDSNTAVLNAIDVRAVARHVLARIARLGPQAGDIACAAAVLGPDATLSNVSELAGVDLERAVEDSDRLVEAGVLAEVDPMAFIHPVVAAAVRDDLPAGRLSVSHLKAAELLRKRGADLDTVCTHLLRTAPVGADWVAETLQGGGLLALGRGTPLTASAYLRRALEEPVTTDLRGQLHLQLGIAGLLSASADSIEYLALALETLTQTAERTVATHLLSLAYQHHDRHQESAELIERELAMHPDRPGEETLILRASQVGALLLSGLHEKDAESLGLNEPEPMLTGQTPAERAMLANIAFYRMQAGWDRASVIEPASRGLEQGLLGDTGATGNIALAIFALLYAEDYPGTAEWGRALAESARTKGDLVEIGMGWWFAGLSQARTGDLPDSEASLLTGYEFVAEVSSPLGALSSVAALLDVRRERGRLAEADALLRTSGLEGEIPLLGPAAAELISARGQLRLAQGRIDDAVRDLRKSQERYAALHLDDFPGLGWRPGLIEALIRTGDHDGATELAEHDLSLAEKLGAQTATAVALRNRALATEADQEEQLGRAAEILRDEPARLQRARTNAELGAFLRRAGRRKEARGVLREALDEARQCGAAPLAARCREELEASGARLRRDRIRGIDALTPSELRVARLAAAGNTNREIAQQLFVSMKTIEKHLGNAYMKLDVSSRTELPGALDAKPQQDSQPSRENGEAEEIPLENPSYPAA